jgi:ankyrin repeat protein
MGFWNSRTPVHHAAAEGLLDLFELLVEKGATVESEAEGRYHRLHSAVCWGRRPLAHLDNMTLLNISLRKERK